MGMPYETEADALDDVSDVYPNYHKWGAMSAKLYDRLAGVCTAHGLTLGAYDREILRWLAKQKPEAAQVIVNLFQRAVAVDPTGRREGSPHFSQPDGTPYLSCEMDERARSQVRPTVG